MIAGLLVLQAAGSRYSGRENHDYPSYAGSQGSIKYLFTLTTRSTIGIFRKAHVTLEDFEDII
jgi:hypothetical protein